MSTSYCVYGITEPDDTWKKMQAVLTACYEAGIQAPDAVMEYFGDSDPEADGMTVNVSDAEYVTEHNEDCENGFIVDVSKLPPQFKKIKFVVRY
jgi:hypothetical protein